MNEQQTPDASIPMEAHIPIDLDISADGKRVAFVVMERVSGEPKRRKRIWVTETEQAAPRPLLSGEYDEMSPRWSPDGKYLAFITQTRYAEKCPHLNVVAAEGGTPQPVWAWSQGMSKLAWAPDSNCITFLSPDEVAVALDASRPTPGARLWAVRLVRHIHNHLEGSWAPGWGPATRQVISKEISSWAPPESITPSEIDVHDYAWSPDGRQLALFYSAGNAFRLPSQPISLPDRKSVREKTGAIISQLRSVTRLSSGEMASNWPFWELQRVIFVSWPD